MIHSLRFKNFFSFEDEAIVHFDDIKRANENRSNIFFESGSGTLLNKLMILIGSNASGKTNTLKAFSFLQWFVAFSFVSLKGEKESIPIDTFNFSKNKNKPAEFEITFEHKNNVYQYILHVCETHVILEELYRKDKATNHFNYIFKRKWNNDTEKSDIIDSIGLNTQVIKEILRKNVSLISLSEAINNDVLVNVIDFWNGFVTNVNRSGKSWHTSSMGNERILEFSELYNENDNIFKKVIQFLKDVDPCLYNIVIKEMNSPGKTGEIKKQFFPYGVHKVGNDEYQLPFIYESSGTKNMYVLLSYLFRILEKGGVAVIDELELDLHPHTLPKIIELFLDAELNPKNSQLIFTTHALDILNHLEKEQILLVEKNKDCRSEIYRLDEVQGVRRDDNIYAKYMSGKYGAVPNI